MAEAPLSTQASPQAAPLDVASLRDYLVTTGGLPADVNVETDPFFALLEAAIKRAQRVGRVGVYGTAGDPFPFRLMGRVTFTSSGAARRRYAVRMHGNWLGVDPMGTLEDLLADLAPPARAREWLARMRDAGHVPPTVRVMLDQDRDGRRTAWLEIEQAPLPLVLSVEGMDHAASLRALALGWRLDGAGAVMMRRARTVMRPEGPQLVQICSGILNGENGDDLASALQRALSPYRVMGVEAWTDVSERFAQTDQAAESLRFVVTPTPITPHRKTLRGLMAAACNAGVAFVELAGALQRSQLCAITLGRGGDGRAHVDLTHQPIGMEGEADSLQSLPDDEGFFALRGAILLELQSAHDQRSARVAIVRQGDDAALEQPIAGEAGSVRVFVSSGFGSDRLVPQGLAAAVLSEASSITDEAGKQRLEWEIAALLLEHGWKLVGWQITPQ